MFQQGFDDEATRPSMQSEVESDRIKNKKVAKRLLQKLERAIDAGEPYVGMMDYIKAALPDCKIWCRVLSLDCELTTFAEQSPGMQLRPSSGNCSSWIRRDSSMSWSSSTTPRRTSGR